MTEEEFIPLYKELLPKVIRTFANRLALIKFPDNIQQRAEDLASETFEMCVKAIRRNNRPRRYSNKKFVWYRFRNVWNRFITKQQKEGVLSRGTVVEYLLSDDDDPCQALEIREHENAQKSILSPTQRNVVDLLEEGLDYGEVREKTNKSPSAFTTFIGRIKGLFIG